MILITHEPGKPRGRFVAYSDGIEIGEMTYCFDGDCSLAFDHTFVDPSMRGQNVARQLYEQAKRFCTVFDYIMVPVCSYVVAQMKRDQQ